MVITPTYLAIFGAMGLAFFGAVLGVGITRLFWAEDLEQARSIDAIRSKTEGHLREQLRLRGLEIDRLRQERH